MRRLFSGGWNIAVTVVLAVLAWKLVPPFVHWAFLDAVWRPDAAACRQASGSCWGFVAEKWRFILFGTFPYEEQWRPAATVGILLFLYGISLVKAFWRKELLFAWLLGLAAIAVLMWGGIAGLPYVENERWGGLALTLLLATFGMAGAFPLAILLALGRRSRLPAIQALCVAYIELIRGVPLISLLFMASAMLPLFLPSGVSVDKLLRAQLALILFAAAYLAEVVRGGLQAVPREQYDIADALGLRTHQKYLFVVLPQALRLAVPPLVNTLIGLFKDTSLVAIIGVFDLLQAVKVSLGEPRWTGFGVEAYLFAALVYFVFCFAMSAYSKRLELSPAGPRHGGPRPAA
jgi:general L-amino acid transport system permease protein